MKSLFSLIRAGLRKIQRKVKLLFGSQLDIVVVFVVSRGKAISEPQKLGKVPHTSDAEIRQCLLMGMPLDDALIQDAAEEDDEDGEEDERGVFGQLVHVRVSERREAFRDTIRSRH